MWFGRLCLLAACHPVYTKRHNVHAHQWQLAVDFMHRTDGDIIEIEHTDVRVQTCSRRYATVEGTMEH